jgi:hypothetical protein
MSDIDDDIKFNNWMKKIDNYLFNKYKLHVTDLPDQLYRLNLTLKMEFGII